MIARFYIKGLHRGWPSYPSNGRLPTKFLVQMDGGDTAWRRMYQDWSATNRYRTKPVPLVVKDGPDYRQLTPEELTLIGYDESTCHQIRTAQ